jgi:hypothetical protein
LGHTVVLAVQNSPRDLLTTPPFAHLTEDNSEVESVIARQQSWDIFEYKDGGIDVPNNSHCVMKKSCALTCKSGAFTCY